MSSQNQIITLFSSESTVQYTKDVFSVLALPRGSIFKFRYASKYIDPIANAILEEDKALNIKALVAFKSAYRSDPVKCFCVPIRIVNIYSVEKMADGYIINFKTEGYPCYTQDYRVGSFADINSSSKEIFETFEQNDYTLWGKPLPKFNMNDDPSRDNENWREISRCLSLIPGYETYHFLKCSSPYIEKWNESTGRQEKKNCTQKDGLTQLVECQSMNIDIEYYAEKYVRNDEKRIEVFVDESILTRSRGLKTVLQSRYGSIKLSFQPKRVANNTISEIVVNTAGTATNGLQTEVVFPVIIIKNNAYRITKTFFSALGALFIALPGIIGGSIPLGGNIAFGAVGVFIVGICNYWESKKE